MTNAELLNDLINWDWNVYRDGDCDLVATKDDNRAYILSSGELIIQKNYDTDKNWGTGAKFEGVKFPPQVSKKMDVVILAIRTKVLLPRFEKWINE